MSSPGSPSLDPAALSSAATPRTALSEAHTPDLHDWLTCYFHFRVPAFLASDIDDLIQDVYLKLSGHSDWNRLAASTAHSVLVDRIRSRKRRIEHEKSAALDLRTFQSPIDSLDAREDLAATIRTLMSIAQNQDERELVRIAIEAAHRLGRIVPGTLGIACGRSVTWGKRTWADLLIRLDAALSKSESSL